MVDTKRRRRRHRRCDDEMFAGFAGTKGWGWGFSDFFGLNDCYYWFPFLSILSQNLKY